MMSSFQPILTIEQILAIFISCEDCLRMVQATPEYALVKADKHFSTSNDLLLDDAIQALSELGQALSNIQVIESADLDV